MRSAGGVWQQLAAGSVVRYAGGVVRSAGGVVRSAGGVVRSAGGVVNSAGGKLQQLSAGSVVRSAGGVMQLWFAAHAVELPAALLVYSDGSAKGSC